MENKDTDVAIPEILTTEQLQAMIAQLGVTEEGEPLRSAMDDLKRALKVNPAACASLLPEDIGSMVEILMKITGKELLEDMATKKSGKTAKQKFDFTDPKVMQEVEDDLF